MPAHCEQFGLRFQYPENWALDEADARTGCESATVVSPGGAFWSVSRHPASTDPHELARTALQAMRQEYESLESEAVDEPMAGLDTVGYDLNFYCLDLTNTAKVRCLRVGDAVYTIFFQAEDREFDALQQVFAAISWSLLEGLRGDQSA
jgi:hypothetical protein